MLLPPKFYKMDDGQKLFIKEINFGAHVPLQRSISKTISKWKYLSAVQFFVANPRTYDHGSHDDLREASDIAVSEDVSVLIHAPYVVRVGGGEKSDKFIRKFYDKWSGLDMISFVAHTVADPSSEMNSMSEYIRDPGFISIENSASKKILDVWKIWEKLDFGSDFSLTLDTQHTFASGMFDWKGYDRTSNFLDSLPVYPEHIHLNDSKKPWNSGVDRHEILGRGFIFSEETDGLDSLFHSGCQLISESPDWEADLTFILDKFY